MILTGEKIKEEIKRGNICIRPFTQSSLQPNSYDFHLGNELIAYRRGRVDPFCQKQPTPVRIGRAGYVLKPKVFYLGITQEVTASKKYAQLLFGDKSLGSLGVWVQITAPLAHVGSKIRWTLEISVLKEIIVYPGMKFGKICFLANFGAINPYGSSFFWNCGRYQENKISCSQLIKDFALPEKPYENSCRH